MTEKLTLDSTDAEAAELALRRTAATGVPCVVVTITGSDHAHVFDADDGDVTPLGTVPLDHPSPSVADTDE